MPVCMAEPCFLMEASDGAALVAVDKSAGTAGRTIDCIGHTDKTDVVVVVLLTLALRPNCVWVHHLYLYFSIRSTY